MSLVFIFRSPFLFDFGGVLVVFPYYRGVNKWSVSVGFCQFLRVFFGGRVRYRLGLFYPALVLRRDKIRAAFTRPDYSETLCESWL